MSSDSHLRIFDLRTPSSASNHLTLAIPIHTPQIRSTPTGIPSNTTLQSLPAEALTHDWNKYRDSIIATAGVDRLIRTFDLRSAQRNGPLNLLEGHEYAIRKVAWSPHLSDCLLSASYDMTCRVWNDGSNEKAPPGEVGRMNRHTEFAVGVDWSLFGSEGWAASVGWDEKICIWDVRESMTRL